MRGVWNGNEGGVKWIRGNSGGPRREVCPVRAARMG